MNLSENNLIKKIFNIPAMLNKLATNFCRSASFLSQKSFSANNKSAQFVFISALFISPNVFSAAGDFISNTATINYDLAGVPASDTANATFIEDRVINYIVSDDNGGAVVPVITDMTNAVMRFSITNTGNSVHDFLLTAKNTAPNPFGLPADNFDPIPGSISVFVESGLTPGYQVGQDTADFIDELNPSAVQIVYVVADLPTINPDDVSAIALIAQIAEGGALSTEGVAINADDNAHISPAGTFSNGGTVTAAGTPASILDMPNVMDTVFNDSAGLSPEDISTIIPAAQDVANNGQHSDTGAFQVTSPVLITKTVTVIDTLGGVDPHPGATLRYQLDVSVSGNVAVDDLIITDAIPANTTYVAGSILLNGVVQTDANDDLPLPAVDFSRTNGAAPVVSIEVDLGENGAVAIATGATNTIIFEVTID